MKKGMILRGIIWLLALVLSLAVFIKSGSWWVTVIPIAMVLIPVISLILNRFFAAEAEIRIALPESARKGESTRGEISLGFPARPPLGRIFAELEIVNDLTYEKVRLTIPLEKTGKGFEGGFDISSRHAGRIRCAADELLLTDYFGVIPVRRVVSAEAHMTVMPDTFPVEIDNAVFTSPRDGDDSRSDRKGNDMTEIFQLRDYQPGDDIHGIHWKLSGKLDKPIYREPAQYVSNTLLIYWDQREGTPEQTDALAEAVFSVGQALVEAGIKFTLGHSEMSKTQTEEIADLDQMIESFTGLLKRIEVESPGPDELTAFGKVLYFTAEQPGFEYDESLQVFICGEPEGLIGNEIVFSPENAAEKLERLTVYEGL